MKKTDLTERLDLHQTTYHAISIRKLGLYPTSAVR
jgi:hypothetical protein